jgi:indole-3-glycerol phosphate synthase
MSKIFYRKTNSILDEICEYKIEQINRKSVYFSELERDTVNFSNTFDDSNFFLIGEIKRKSPSDSNINPNLDIDNISEIYNTNDQIGAISVLTDDKYFGGNPMILQKTRAKTNKPILRKDFIIDQSQIDDTKAMGADILLLIKAILDDSHYKDLFQYAKEIGLNVITEIHNTSEMEEIMKINPDIIGINNRNLKTFEIDLNTFSEIASELPKDKQLIAESGIYTNEDLRKVSKNGAKAALIGTSIMKANDKEEKINSLMKDII